MMTLEREEKPRDCIGIAFQYASKADGAGSLDYAPRRFARDDEHFEFARNARLPARSHSRPGKP